jgi:hypothetical protein
MIKGALCGMTMGMGAFIYSLAADDMNGTLFRPDATGKIVFTPGNILNIMKQPFIQKFFWSKKYWSINWIIMVTAGACMGICIEYIAN